MDSFFHNIFRNAISPERRLAIFTLPNKTTSLFDDVDQAATYAKSLSGLQDVYYGLSLIRGNPTGRGKREDTSAIGTLWVDIDIASEVHNDKSLPTSVDEAVEFLASLPIAPSIIVHSGHGLHGYWLLQEPVLFDTEEERVHAEKLTKGWHGYVCEAARRRGWSLENLGDLARVLRPPGTRNIKDVEHPVDVALVEYSVYLRYRQEDFHPYMIDIQRNTSAKATPVPQVPFDAKLAEKIKALAKTSPLFARTWEHKRFMRDPSLSSYDMAIANILVKAGFHDPEIAAAIAEGRRMHGKTADEVSKGTRSDYLTITIAEARARTPISTPTDTAPEAGPPWLSISEIGSLPQYREGLPTVTTGFETLNAALHGGLRPESMYIIAGRTGSAKSTLALNIARRSALDGNSVLLLKLEESPVEAVWQLHAAASQVSLSKLMDGATLLVQERQALIDGWSLIRHLPIRISDARHIDAVERIAMEHAQSDGNIIVIDQLSMIDVPDLRIGYEKATAISNRLRLLARTVHMPIVLVSQVNRPASKSESRLSCNDLRDSGCLENDAAAVFLIDKVREPDGPRWGNDPLTLEIIIGKNRYGRSTRPDDDPLKLRWWPSICRIEDPVPPAERGVA